MSAQTAHFFQTYATLVTICLTGASAVFYVVAMVAMKHWVEAPSAIIMLAIIIAFIAGAGFEIAALKGERLGMIYVTILGIEVVLIAIAAVFLLGESFTLRECTGCVLVVLGAALAWA